MNSKEFSELLISQRVKADASIDETSERMGVTRYVVQDIELGVYNTYMELAMKYLNALGLHLALISDKENQPIIISTYDELAKWCAKKWPSYYKYRELGMDIQGIRRIKVSGIGVEKYGIARKRFLELAERDGYFIEIVKLSEVPDLQVKHQEILEAKKKKDAKDQAYGCLFLVAMVGVISAFVYVVSWITLHLPKGVFDDIGFFGALISLTPAFGLIFPFLVVAISLIFVIWVIYLAIHWLVHSK